MGRISVESINGMYYYRRSWCQVPGLALANIFQLATSVEIPLFMICKFFKPEKKDKIFAVLFLGAKSATELIHTKT